MINFGIYVNSLAPKELAQNVCDELKRGLDEKLILDASIFYDQATSIECDLPCGLFHSSELWNFKGHLLTLSIQSAIKVKNIVNGIDLYLGYGWGDKNLLATLKILEEDNVKTICYSKEMSEDFYRVTGRQSIGYSPTLKNTINFIMESKNE